MSILAANSHIIYRDSTQNQNQQSQQHLMNNNFSFLVLQKNSGFDRTRKIVKRDCKVEAFWSDLSRPTFVEMEPINDSENLDTILRRAQELSQPIIIDWMAAWCRKCIYLKPKLEKLAAEYDTQVKFYYVDVNKVPQSLVKRGNISKMPTIQLWKDGEMKEEVIGGHKAWLVMDEVREMIQKFV